MITEHVVRACEKLRSLQIYQSWLGSVLGIAKRRGGAMLGSAELEGIYVYREQCVVLVDFLFGPGASVACCIGQWHAIRMKDAFEETAFVVAAAAARRRGVDHHMSESQARALAELRRATQPVVDGILHLVRTEQELPLAGSPTGESGAPLAKGGESSGGQ